MTLAVEAPPTRNTTLIFKLLLIHSAILLHYLGDRFTTEDYVKGIDQKLIRKFMAYARKIQVGVICNLLTTVQFVNYAFPCKHHHKILN